MAGYNTHDRIHGTNGIFTYMKTFKINHLWGRGGCDECPNFLRVVQRNHLFGYGNPPGIVVLKGDTAGQNLEVWF